MAENTAPGETGDGLTIIGPDDGIGWQPDPDGPQAHALVQGKREVAVDAVTPVPGRPGEYYVFIGDTYARIAPVISFVTQAPAQDGAPSAQPRTLPDSVVFVQPPPTS